MKYAPCESAFPLNVLLDVPTARILRFSDIKAGEDRRDGDRKGVHSEEPPGTYPICSRGVETPGHLVYKGDRGMLLLYAPSPKSEIGDGVESLRIDFAVLQESFWFECSGVGVDFLVS